MGFGLHTAKYVAVSVSSDGSLILPAADAARIVRALIDEPGDRRLAVPAAASVTSRVSLSVGRWRGSRSAQREPRPPARALARAAHR